MAEDIVADPDPRFRCSYPEALTFLFMGYKIRRAGWPEKDAYVMEDGIVLTVIGRSRLHSVPVGDILAKDWTVAVK